MKYKKPQVTIEKYTLNVPVMADVASSIDPIITNTPVMEKNDAIQELADNFSSFFDFNQ